MGEINKTSLNKFETYLKQNKEFVKKRRPDLDDDKCCSYAVAMTVLREYYSIDMRTAFDSITDGSNDCKIDAFFYDEAKRPTTLVLIQAKHKRQPGDTSTFTADEIKLTIENAKKLIQGRDLDNPSEELQDKIDNFRDMLKSQGNLGINIVLFFATNGIIYDEHKKLEIIQQVAEEHIICKFVDATDFGYEVPSLDGKLVINLKSNSPTEDETDKIFLKKGFVCSTTIKDLLEFYKESGKQALLNSNVRFKLLKSPINNQIRETFTNSPTKFCFLNNGIYIVCTDWQLDHDGNGRSIIKFQKPNIINGGQTIATLFDVVEKGGMEPDCIEKAKILIRVYKTDNEQELLEIATATNSQNPIDIVDLKSNDMYQEQVKRFFEKRGIGLLVKEGEDTLYYDDTINNETLLQIYAALYKGEPALAKVSKKSIFKRYFPIVFNAESIENGVNEQLFRAYELNKKLYEQKDIEDKEQQKIIAHAWYALLYVMGRIQSSLLIPRSNLNTLFQDAFDKSFSLIKELVEERNRELGAQFSYNNLFKSSEVKSFLDKKIEMQQQTTNSSISS